MDVIHFALMCAKQCVPNLLLVLRQNLSLNYIFPSLLHSLSPSCSMHFLLFLVKASVSTT